MIGHREILLKDVPIQEWLSFFGKASLKTLTDGFFMFFLLDHTIDPRIFQKTLDVQNRLPEIGVPPLLIHVSRISLDFP